MKKQYVFSKWLQKSAIVFAAILAFSGAAFGQANFWTVFGDEGCNYNKRLTCAVSPTVSSFSGVASLLDHILEPGFASSYQNSCYDQAGNLLFSVNGDGLYSSGGTQLMEFLPNDTEYFPFTLTSGVMSYATPGLSVSEFTIFPFPGKCNSYYVVFWCNDQEDNTYELRAIEVDVNPALYPSDACLNITDNVIIDTTEGNYSYGTCFGCGSDFRFAIAADAPNIDGSRDIYTVNPADSGLSKMRKWEIASDGTLPKTAYIYYNHRDSAKYQSNAYSPKAKILNIGGNKYFTYISGTSGTGLYSGVECGYYLNLYTLTDATSIYPSSTFNPMMHSSDTQEIMGFEFDSIRNVIYFSYVNEHSGTILSGGLGYWDAVGGIHLSSNPTDSFEYSDIERDKNGDLYFVKGTPPYDGQLAYLLKTSPLSTTIFPVTCTTSCGSYPLASVLNNIYSGSIEVNFTGYYLGSQIRGDSYSWGIGMAATYTVTTTVTWTNSSNPVTVATGIPTSTISMNNIIIAPGGSLTISGMTVQMAAGSHIDVENSTSSSPSIGGRLVLTNATLTPYTGSCGGGYMWGGIRVWGDAAQSQNPASTSDYSHTHQGLLTSNGSTITYADTAVFLGIPNVTHLSGGGGGVIASASTFKNNGYDVVFLPYSNFFPTTPRTERTNISKFTQCNFSANDPSVVTGVVKYNVYGFDVNTISFSGCNFTNNLGSGYTTYGIYAEGMGINVNYSLVAPLTSLAWLPSTFSNYTYGIFHLNVYNPSHTATVAYTTFTNNVTGIYLSGTNAPLIAFNTFHVPFIVIPGLYGGMIQSVGINLFTADNFGVYENLFQYEPGTGIVLPRFTETVGILAWNTEHTSENNLINNNTFSGGLGTGNLAEFNNFNDGEISGLWYECNNNTWNNFDIATVGDDPSPSGDGIRIIQGSLGTISYPDGLPAGNTFSAYPSYNLYNVNTECEGYVYIYNPALAPNQTPGTPPTTGTNYDHSVGLSAFSASDQCPVINSYLGTSNSNYNNTSSNGALPLAPMVRHADSSGDANIYALAVQNNINYYMNDTNGIPHRDSLYYWVGQMPQGGSGLLQAQLLLADGYVDSATTIFNNLAAVDSLDSTLSLEFNGGGSALYSVQSGIAAYKASIRNAIATAYTLGVDPDSTLAADSALFSGPVVDTGAMDSLMTIFGTSRMWAHVGAENLLATYFPAAYDSLLAAMPDKFLYPTAPDTLPQPASPSGVLVVTEISQGPAADTGACAYTELAVANCGNASSPYVNIAGWIIDDNSGIFDTAGCTSGNSTITRGHYRLSPYCPLWQNIRIGTIIVLYNGVHNCYNLPDSFTVDTANFVVYIPLYDTCTDTGYALCRYDGAENADPGTYCSDTGTNVYTGAYGWQRTVALTPADAVQVRCPGCSATYPGAPAFYQGIGFAPDSTYCFNGVAAGANSPGGALVIGGSYQKYVFTGSALADFTNPAMWTATAADAAGTPPSTLGNIDSALYASIMAQTLGMPCCGNAPDGGRKASGGGNASATTNTQNTPQAGIKVFPNPATGTLYFQYPLSGTATITLSDIAGRLLSTQTVTNAATATLNISGYAPGVYLYQVTTGALSQSGKVEIK